MPYTHGIMIPSLQRSYVHFFVAAAYASALANIETLFVWGGEIKDRQNYLNYFFVHESLLESLLQGNFLSIVTSEPVFTLLWVSLSHVTDTELSALKVLIFSSSLVASFVILERRGVPFFWKALILVFPWFLVNYIMTLRQGVAIAVLLYAHFYLAGRWRWVLYAITPLIHYSFFLVLVVLILANVLKAGKVTNSVRLLSLNIFAILSSILVLSIVSGWVLIPIKELESLSLGYAEKISLNLGFGFLYSGVVLILMLTSERDFIKNNLISIIAITIYLYGVIFFPPISRFLQIFSPLIVLAGLQLTGYRLLSFKGLLVLHVIYFFVISIYAGGPSGMLVGDN